LWIGGRKTVDPDAVVKNAIRVRRVVGLNGEPEERVGRYIGVEEFGPAVARRRGIDPVPHREGGGSW